MFDQNSDSLLRIGIIGCGHWGKHYVRNFSALPQSTVTCVCDTDCDKLTIIQKLYPHVKVFTDHRALLDSGLCDGVVVSTIASTHYSIARDAIEAQLHVLAEKPLTLSVDEAEDLVRLSQQHNRILMVAHTFLYNPSIREMKKYLDQGILGDIYYIKARRTHLGLIRGDVNVVWDLAPHDISILLYFLEERPSQIQVMAGRFLKNGREDVAYINLSFPSSVMASLIVSWADSNKERYLDVVGSKARLVFDDLDNLEPLRLFHKGISIRESNTGFGEFRYLLRDGDIISPKIETTEPLKVLCSEFLDSMVTGNSPLSDGNFGRDVVAVLSDIQKAGGVLIDKNG